MDYHTCMVFGANKMRIFEVWTVFGEQKIVFARCRADVFCYHTDAFIVNEIVIK
jgi:hypothetical protein